MTALLLQERSFVRICVDDELLDVLAMSPLSQAQTIMTINGENFVDAFMLLTEDLLHWIQCMGSAVEVIHPPGLRELVRQGLIQTLHKYRVV